MKEGLATFVARRASDAQQAKTEAESPVREDRRRGAAAATAAATGDEEAVT